MASVPFGAMPDDTGEYMLGDVAVNVVLMESDPTIGPRDNSTENWTAPLIQEVKDKVNAGLQWWKDTLAKAYPAMAGRLNFIVDYQYADNPVHTGYEPINRKSDDFQNWMYDFLRTVGYSQTGDFSADVRAYNDAQRRTLHTNWAFTMFVVNSTVDPDESFAAGGTFPRAFSYAGGRFMVIPSGRPTSTFAHETGHMFWARDEYLGEDYTTRRGYYNTQNLNAARAGYTQVPSIMSTGQSLIDAFSSKTSSSYTLEMIGWRDSDGDGIPDVLDVPLTLTGSGRYNSQTGQYRFVGSSSVQTLPNLNSSGLQNDITINEVSRAEFRVDGGPWQLATMLGGYQANLDFTFLVSPGDHAIDVRTIDDSTQVSSPIFQGTTARPTTILDAGINGFVFQDANADQQFDTSEAGLAAWTVQLLGNGGQPLVLQQTVDPDSFAANSVLQNPIPGVTLSATGPDTDGVIYAVPNPIASLGGNVFGTYDPNVPEYTPTWNGSVNRATDSRLRIDFTSPTTTVSLNAIGRDGNDYARLEIYDVNDNLLARYTTKALAAGQVETMTLRRPVADIAYAIARPHLSGSSAMFDRLQLGAKTSTTTDAQGAYHLPSLPAGTYRVHVTPPASWTPSGPAPADIVLTLASGAASSSVDFAALGIPNVWHNARLPEDVDDSGAVIPLDALLVINDLNVNGGRRLPSPGVGPQAPPPYLDVNDDGWLSPIDALIVINKLNGAGAGAASGGAGPSGGAANGEAPDVVPFTTLSANSAPQAPMDIRQLLASTYRSTLAVSTADGEAKSALRNAHKSTAKSGIRAFLADSGVTDAWLDQVASDVGQIWHGDDDQCDGHSHWDVD